MEYLLMGCGNLQVTTAVMQYGYRIIDDLIEGLSDYLALRGFTRVQDIVGRALTYIVSADELDRSSIQYPRFVRKQCIGCGRCYISCYDGGHQAIQLGKDTKPLLDVKKCVGCHLCLLVCPAQAIEAGKRVQKKE
jgi:dihydropyrimidine dehydrogenase (NAD+) subunit PreA